MEIEELLNSTNIEDEILGWRLLYEISPDRIWDYNSTNKKIRRGMKSHIILKFDTLCIALGTSAIILVKKDVNIYDNVKPIVIYDFRNRTALEEQ